MTRLSKPSLQVTAALGLAAFICSCQSILPYKMGGNPANLRPGATALEVVEEMGSPTSKRQHVRGETWVYKDYWWVKEIWVPHWASWEIYMEKPPGRLSLLRMCGWKLIDPPGQEPEVRSAVYVRRRFPVTATAPSPAAETTTALAKNPPH
ncbi:hypothetical protein [Verrucomicrobium sp. BvORR106]|uniref:hypothetical protein n=1 Tax=Verrucomicrobium sp. BvORR106 TaxID=1403819 RepID=UPI002240ECBD|nr:hypothetical protein [Verrucomicrobium sp. BvORR106]